MREREEDFVEMLPPEVGHNRRHYRANINGHAMSADCPCGPDEIPHSGDPVTTPAALTVDYDYDHEHIFVEEQEPSGRLILPPCIVTGCGLTAMDAIEALREVTP